MVGRLGEEKVAERLRKPMSGVVVGKLGLFDETGKPEAWRETDRT